MKRTHILSLSVGALLLFALLRLPALSVFPPFIDEGFSVEVARDILAGRLTPFATEARTFTIWLLALFQAPSATDVLWLIRAVSALVTLIGFAAFIGTARLLGGNQAALFAALIGLFSPYHFFYERLALADPLAAAAALCAVYFAARLSQRAALSDAVLCGVALFAAVGFKLTVIAFLGVPLAAFLTLNRGYALRVRLRWLAVALGSAAALTAAFAALQAWRGYNWFGPITAHNTGGFSLARLAENIPHTVALLGGFFGVPFSALLVAALCLLVARRQFFVPLCSVGILGVLWLNQTQYGRFFGAAFSLLLLGAALGLAEALRRTAWRGAAGGALLIMVWAALFFVPFRAALLAGEAPPTLPDAEYREYVSSDASGFRLEDVLLALHERGAQRVVGVIANCEGLRMRARGSLTVICPRLQHSGANREAVAEEVRALRQTGTFGVLEAIPYLPEQLDGEVVLRFQKPRQGSTYTLYDLAPR
jgi:4-amino-4-deoxy-L-arabinose transferase-like glycosyltransferase